VIVAVHAGLEVLGISVITDMCQPDALEGATVEQSLAVARTADGAEGMTNVTLPVAGVAGPGAG
jgi:purine nucleoside phosphorylase